MAAGIKDNADAIAKEIKDRADAITEVNTAISNANGLISGLDGRMGAAEGKITALEGKADKVAEQISTAVSAEETRAKAAEKKLTDDLQAEATERATAVNNINAKIGDVAEDKNLVEMINAAEAAAKADAEGKINPLADRIKVIEDDYLKAADKAELVNLIAAEAAERETQDGETLKAAKKYTDTKLTWGTWNA